MGPHQFAPACIRAVAVTANIGVAYFRIAFTPSTVSSEYSVAVPLTGQQAVAYL
jgi:hypothetical protein